jgi:hypothetical protein
MLNRAVLFVAVVLVLLAAQSQAAITAVSLGTAAPPPTIGPYTMTPFPLDSQPVGSYVTQVASPLGGDVGIDTHVATPALHTLVGVGWATWSHGYTGDVYPTYDDPSTWVTLTMPTGTKAFYFYAEPDPFEVWTITATADDGTQLSQDVNGDSGAAGFGFYGDAMTNLASIDVTSGTDFAVGEFGIASGAIPEPASLIVWSLLGGLGVALAWRRRKAAA